VPRRGRVGDDARSMARCPEMAAGPVLALVPGKVHVLGASVPNDGQITWLPAGAGGYVPLNAYLLTEGRQGMLVDTSFPVIEQTIVGQASTFDLDDVTLVLTRNTEFDSVGNAEPLLDVLPITTMYGHFNPSEWIYFRTATGPADATGRFESRVFSDDQVLTLAPGRKVTVINARLKLLATAWLYDHATKVLFSSDTFSHVLAADPAQRIVRADGDRTTEAAVREHLMLKFDWLEGADTDPLRAFLDGVFHEFDVETIAPSHGCILAGRDIVRRHHAMVDAVLRDVGVPAVATAGGAA
jgi:flavorubredoxin